MSTKDLVEKGAIAVELLIPSYDPVYDRKELLAALTQVAEAAKKEERERIEKLTTELRAEYQVPARRGGYYSYVRSIATHVLDKVLASLHQPEEH